MGERGTVVEKQVTLCFLSSSIGRKRGNTPDSQIGLPRSCKRICGCFLPLHRSGMERHEKCNWLFKAFRYFQFQSCYCLFTIRNRFKILFEIFDILTQSNGLLSWVFFMGYVSADVHVASTFGVLQMEFLVLSTAAVVSSFLWKYRIGKEILMGFHTACGVYKLC